MYFKPQKIRCAEGAPSLASGFKTVVFKSSWPGLDRQGSEADMFSACKGRFGVMPHVYSYEVTGEDGQVISNILFFPERGSTKARPWLIFSKQAPEEYDIRIYNHAIFGPDAEGTSFIHAENPYELSRAWAHSLLGALVAILLDLE